MTTLPARLTDKLDAVNVLLSAIGEAPVNDLTVSESVDVANATATLNEIQLAVLSRGWAWNTEERYPLAKDNRGKIALPDTALRVRSAYWPDSNTGPRVSERARKLYDRDNHTFVFTQDIEVDLVVYLEWEDMPEMARRYITIRAAKQMQGRFQGSQTVDRITDDEVALALATLEQSEDDDAGGNNVLTGNADVASRLYGKGVRRRH